MCVLGRVNVCAFMRVQEVCYVPISDWGVAAVKFGVPFPQFNDEKRLMGYHQNLQNIIEDQVRGGNA